MSDTPTTEIEVYNNSFVQSLAAVATESEEISIFGFDTTTKEGMIRLFNAQEDADSLSESGVTELTVDGILIQPGVRVNPVTGERSACANTTLITADGAYVSQSNGVARTAARIVALYRNVGWPVGGVKVVVIEQNLDHGMTYKKLRLIG